MSMNDSIGTPWPATEAEEDQLLEQLARARLIERDGKWPSRGDVAAAKGDIVNEIRYNRTRPVVSREAARLFLNRYGIKPLAKKAVVAK